jgi:tetratricopeptide (TPR) repeat protein
MLLPASPGGIMILPRALFPLLLLILSAGSLAATQSNSDDAYKDERKQALVLFNARKYFDALPLFEDLAQKNPKDSDVLLGLGSCIINRSVTLDDAEAAKKERIRGREFLVRAKQLGNNSTLLQNLLDVTPVDGSIRHDANPDVDKALQAGEAAFAKHDFDEAIKNYSHALELDPKNYGAALYVADASFAKGDYAKAAEGYDHAIAVDPDRETAYRYEADMFTKGKLMDRARDRAIQAVVAEPYKAITWRGLGQWATVNHLQLNRVHITTHGAATTDNSKTTITLNPNMPSAANAVWLAYGAVHANWQNEKFKKIYPQETQYRHSLAEEAEALSLAAKVLPNSPQDSAYNDPDLALLKKLSDAGMLEPYILLSAPDAGIAQDYVSYREQNRSRLEGYLGQFVVPPAPPRQ